MSVKKIGAVIAHGAFSEGCWQRLGEQRIRKVILPEGRPVLNGMRLSCRQLNRRGVTPFVIADNMFGFLFYRKRVREVWLAYQAADKTGVLCQIGALILGVLAKQHGVAVYAFPAKEKLKYLAPPETLKSFNGTPILASGRVKAYVPMVEWVPLNYIRKVFHGC